MDTNGYKYISFLGSSSPLTTRQLVDCIKGTSNLPSGMNQGCVNLFAKNGVASNNEAGGITFSFKNHKGEMAIEELRALFDFPGLGKDPVLTAGAVLSARAQICLLYKDAAFKPSVVQHLTYTSFDEIYEWTKKSCEGLKLVSGEEEKKKGNAAAGVTVHSVQKPSLVVLNCGIHCTYRSSFESFKKFIDKISAFNNESEASLVEFAYKTSSSMHERAFHYAASDPIPRPMKPADGGRLSHDAKQMDIRYWRATDARILLFDSYAVEVLGENQMARAKRLTL
jgi:hypothetical protein